MGRQKVPTASEVLDSKKSKKTAKEMLDNAQYWDSQHGNEYRKTDIKTGKTSGESYLKAPLNTYPHTLPINPTTPRKK